MSKTKFKIGDQIFFMNYGEPAKSNIKGIQTVIGEVETHNQKDKGTEENPCIKYCMPGYVMVEESKAFATLEDLKIDLFKKLE